MRVLTPCAQVYIMRRKLAPRFSRVVVIVGAGHLPGIRRGPVLSSQSLYLLSGTNFSCPIPRASQSCMSRWVPPF